MPKYRAATVILTTDDIVSQQKPDVKCQAIGLVMILLSTSFYKRHLLVMIYLGELVEAQPKLCDRLVYLSQPLPDNPAFLLYRLLGGLTEAINTCFWLHKDLLRKSLRENP